MAKRSKKEHARLRKKALAKTSVTRVKVLHSASAPAPAVATAPAESAYDAADAAPPETVRSDDHRSSPRVSVVVAIHLSSDSHFFSGLSGDISEGGLFLSTYRPLTVGSAVDLEFSLPGSDESLHARGEVRWLREHSSEQPRGVGIAFEELPEADRDRIHRFCTMRPPLYYDDVG